MQENLIEKIEKQAVQQKLEWEELYGLGKGLWDNEDAQDYVTKLREDRT